MVVHENYKIWQEISNLAENYQFLDKPHLSIPFSITNNSKKPKDVYNGQEKIYFNDRDQDYKIILIQEFLT